MTIEEMQLALTDLIFEKFSHENFYTECVDLPLKVKFFFLGEKPQKDAATIIENFITSLTHYIYTGV